MTRLAGGAPPGLAGGIMPVEKPSHRSPSVPRRTPPRPSPLWLQKGARPNEAAARARQAGIRDAEGRQVNRTRPLVSTLGRRTSGWQLLAWASGPSRATMATCQWPGSEQEDVGILAAPHAIPPSIRTSCTWQDGGSSQCLARTRSPTRRGFREQLRWQTARPVALSRTSVGKAPWVARSSGG